MGLCSALWREGEGDVRVRAGDHEQSDGTAGGGGGVARSEGSLRGGGDTDSQYMKNGITDWIHKWKRNGWRTASKKPVVNQDLWQELDEQVARHKTEWSWTKGHASHDDNNRCDELATAAARNRRSHL